MKFRPKNIGLVYHKEILDILRDRRTVMSMIVVPLVLFPLLMIVMGSIITSQVQELENQQYSVLIVGMENDPELVARLSDSENLDVQELNGDENAEYLVQEGLVETVLLIPPMQAEGSEEAPEVMILANFSREQSQIASRRVRDELEAYRQVKVEELLDREGVSTSILEPFKITRENVATGEQMTGQLLGTMLPYMLILLTLNGGLYPAVDLTAGEKERGTLETVLVSAASRFEIVLGKFFTVMTASLITAFISFVSFSLVFGYGFTMMTASATDLGFEFSISPLAVLLSLAMVIPLSAFFSSLLMTISIFAKSSREAQSYVVPLIFIVILPAMMSMMPGSGAESNQAWIPVVNVSLVMKDILTGSIDWSMVIITIASTTLYALAGIFVTMRVFQRESVLFRI